MATPLRVASALVLGGLAGELAVSALHPAHEAPNDHAAVFAEYAATSGWTLEHLGEFAARLVLLLGLFRLLAVLAAAGAPAPAVDAGRLLTGSAAALLAVLKGIDGVALKQTVDALAAAPPAARAAAFADAETVRWLEWAAAGYLRVVFGLALAATGWAVLGARLLPRLAGVLALVAGAAFVADGVRVQEVGFTGEPLAPGAAWAALSLFALVTAAAAWWPEHPGRLIRRF
jgi:hypothetical protein